MILTCNYISASLLVHKYSLFALYSRFQWTSYEYCAKESSHNFDLFIRQFTRNLIRYLCQCTDDLPKGRVLQDDNPTFICPYEMMDTTRCQVTTVHFWYSLNFCLLNSSNVDSFPDKNVYQDCYINRILCLFDVFH